MRWICKNVKVWDSGDQAVTKFLAHINHCGHLPTMISQYREKCMAEQWGGALGCMQQFTGQEEDLMFPMTEHQSIGACPWLVAVKRNIFRAGAANISLPYVGHLVHMAAGDVYVFCIALEYIVGLGISALDIWAFLGTAAGKKATHEHSYIFKVTAGGMAQIPWGYLFLPMYVSNEKKVERSDIAFMVMQAIWGPALIVADAVSSQVLRATKQVNDLQFAQRSTHPMWTARQEFFSAFIKDRLVMTVDACHDGGRLSPRPTLGACCVDRSPDICTK